MGTEVKIFPPPKEISQKVKIISATGAFFGQNFTDLSRELGCLKSENFPQCHQAGHWIKTAPIFIKQELGLVKKLTLFSGKSRGFWKIRKEFQVVFFLPQISIGEIILEYTIDQFQ